MSKPDNPPDKQPDTQPDRGPDNPLHEVDPENLEAATGGMRWDANSRESTNVIDCRGATCVDSTGKTDWKATMQHKVGIGNESKPLPKGDGGPLPGPRVPRP